jgi:hypothetical protein
MEGMTMYLVLRRYKDASALLDAFEQNRSQIERLLRDVSGFREYFFVRSHDDGMTITVCDDRRAGEETNLLAADLISELDPGGSGSAPEVIEGEVRFHIEAGPAGR